MTDNAADFLDTADTDEPQNAGDFDAAFARLEARMNADAQQEQAEAQPDMTAEEKAQARARAKADAEQAREDERAKAEAARDDIQKTADKIFGYLGVAPLQEKEKNRLIIAIRECAPFYRFKRRFFKNPKWQATAGLFAVCATIAVPRLIEIRTVSEEARRARYAQNVTPQPETQTQEEGA